ncbi:hypothetical protein ACLB1G_00935 [Oxalobacteraceae bacterium A2-2]
MRDLIGLINVPAGAAQPERAQCVVICHTRRWAAGMPVAAFGMGFAARLSNMICALQQAAVLVVCKRWRRFHVALHMRANSAGTAHISVAVIASAASELIIILIL